jgi:hypothetical protein
MKTFQNIIFKKIRVVCENLLANRCTLTEYKLAIDYLWNLYEQSERHYERQMEL